MNYIFKGYADRYTVIKGWEELCSKDPTPYNVLDARDKLNRDALVHEKDVPELYLQMVSGWPIRDCEVIDENGDMVVALLGPSKEMAN